KASRGTNIGMYLLAAVDFESGDDIQLIDISAMWCWDTVTKDDKRLVGRRSISTRSFGGVQKVRAQVLVYRDSAENFVSPDHFFFDVCVALDLYCDALGGGLEAT